jgi:predicted nucleic acid-binding protein
MLGLDTNVLVPFLVRDHEAQFERARRLIKREIGAQEKVLISLLVLLETEWMLLSRYGLQKIKSRTPFPDCSTLRNSSSKTSPRLRKRFTSGRTALPILQTA